MHSGVIEDHTHTYTNNRNTKKHKKLSAQEHFYAHMRMPIGVSSIRIPITEDVRKSIEAYKLRIEERIRNHTY